MAHTAAPQRVGKRSGAVQFEHYQKDAYQKRLDPVIERINAMIDTTKFRFDRRSLSNTIAGLQQFMEDALGINAPNKPFLKVPAKLFKDFSPEGPLTIVGRLCAEMIISKKMKKIDWGNPANRRELIDMVLRIRQELLRAGYIKSPVIFVRPDCPNASLLRHTISNKLNGKLAAAENASGVTHVICPYGPKGDPDDGQEYLRTLEVSGGAAHVHWWYLPDSYDEWLPAAAAPMDIEPELKPPGSRPWKVYHRFITDTDKYNEWMNEADYETEEAAAENKRAREAGEVAVEEVRDKKRMKKSNIAAEVAPGALENVAPGAVTRRLLNPHPLGLNPPRIEGISFGQRQEWAGAPSDPHPTTKTTDRRSKDSNGHHRIPAKASWFTYSEIHAIEKNEFSEFFRDQHASLTGKTPEVYTALRNHIITRYRENPTHDLTFTEACKSLDADANDVRKVFDFLVRWGIINWHSATEGAVLGLPAGSGEPVGTDALIRLNKIPSPADAAEALVVGNSRITVRPGTFRAVGPQQPAIASGIKYFCNVHPHEDCTALRYHCTKIPDIDICPSAYNEGRFPPGCSSKDFVRIAATDAVHDSSGWSDQETMLLLEGMELYNDDWVRISEHVGGRSQLQCIQRLLQLPIEDQLLPPLGAGDVPLTRTLVEDATGNGEFVETEERMEGPLPFADTGNPVMAQVAFLTTMVGPRIAAAAAQRALEVLAEEDAKGVDGDSDALPENRVRVASAAGLAAAAVKARLMADAEEREMQRYITIACENQLRRVVAKLAFLEKVDEVLKNEIVPYSEKAAQLERELKALKEEPEPEGPPPAGPEAVAQPPQQQPPQQQQQQAMQPQAMQPQPMNV